MEKTLNAILAHMQGTPAVVSETQPIKTPKGKAKVAKTQPVIAGMPAHVLALLGQPIAKAGKDVVPHDVTVDFDATIRETAALAIEFMQAGRIPNAAMIPFGIGDETARPARCDYRVYLDTPSNRRFKTDRKAAGVPMLDACIALADAVESLAAAK